MTPLEMKELQTRFRNIIRRGVSSGTFLSTSFTGANGSLNVPEFTKYMMESDQEGEDRDDDRDDDSRMTSAQVQWFLGLLDTNGDGRVDYREFLHFTYNTRTSQEEENQEKKEDNDDEKNDDDDEKKNQTKQTKQKTESSKPVSPAVQDLKYQVDYLAKDLSNIFTNVVKSGRVTDFRDIFTAMDEDGSGTVDHNEFMDALERFDFVVPNEEVRRELLQRFDHDGDGDINYVEFVNFCLAYAMDSNVGSIAQTSSSKDTAEGRVRLALTHFVETNGGASSLSNVFVQLNAHSLGNGVLTHAMVGSYCFFIFISFFFNC